MKITWAWIAGFYEGEGSAGWCESSRRFRFHITQKGRKILDDLYAFLGFGHVDWNGTGCWTWRVNDLRLSFQFYRRIYLYLSLRRRKQVLKSVSQCLSYKRRVLLTNPNRRTRRDIPVLVRFQSFAKRNLEESCPTR